MLLSAYIGLKINLKGVKMKFNNIDIEGTDWIEDIHKNLWVEDAEVWDQAKNFEEMPNFENILIGIRFDKLEEYIKEVYPVINNEMDRFVNCMDSHFYIKDYDSEWVEIKSMKDIQAVENGILDRSE